MDRRAILFVALACLVGAAGRLCAEDADNVADLRTRTFGSDWPCFLGPTFDSKSTETGILTDWPANGPPQVWTRKLGEGYAAPAISKGRLFEFSRFGDREQLTCVHSETGQVLWEQTQPTDYVDKYGYDGGPRAQPVVDVDRVYTYGAAGLLTCYRVSDGKVLWSIDTREEFGVVQNFFGVGSTPIVDGELIIVQVGGSPPGSDRVPFDALTGNSSGLVALDKTTGEIRYRVSNELASYASPVAVTIDERRWGFLLARGGLIGFDPKTGAERFHFPWKAKILESVNASTPIVVDDQVFISETYGPGSALLRISSNGYDVVWADEAKSRRKAMQTHWNTPIHHQGYVYGSSGRNTHDAELRCIELATGEVQWSQPRLGRASLLFVDGHFVCLAEYGELLLFKANPSEFEVVDVAIPVEQSIQPDLPPRRLLAYPAWAAPVLSHGLLYVRGKDRLVCMELIPTRE